MIQPVITPNQEVAEALDGLRNKFVEWLDEQAAVIETNRARGRDVKHLEDLWTSVIDVYGKLSDKSRDLHSNK